MPWPDDGEGGLGNVPGFFAQNNFGLQMHTVMQAFGDLENPAAIGPFTVSGSRFFGTRVVPEPTVLALLGIGLAAFGVSRRRLRG